MVLFRGGESNRQQAQAALEAQGLEEAELWVDLRQDPGSLKTSGRQLSAEELPEDEQWTEDFYGIRLSLINQRVCQSGTDGKSRDSGGDDLPASWKRVHH